MPHQHGRIALLLTITGTFAAITAAHAQAPDGGPPITAVNRLDRYTTTTTLAAALEGEDARASKLIGMPVFDRSGEALGEVKDLLTTPDRQREPTVVISVGGVLGIGDKLYASSFKELYLADRHALVLDKTPDQLKSAPPFEYAPREGERSYKPGATGPGTTNSVGDLLGAVVVDERGKSIGKVDDLVVSTREHGTRAIVELNSGAGKSEDGKLVAIPFDELHVEITGEEAKGVPQRARVRANFEDTPIEALPPYQYSGRQAI